MQLKVDGCSDCPLCNISLKLDFYCAHPKFDEKVLFIESDVLENPITPKECPLSEQPIIMKFIGLLMKWMLKQKLKEKIVLKKRR